MDDQYTGSEIARTTLTAAEVQLLAAKAHALAETPFKEKLRDMMERMTDDVMDRRLIEALRRALEKETP